MRTVCSAVAVGVPPWCRRWQVGRGECRAMGYEGPRPSTRVASVRSAGARLALRCSAGLQTSRPFAPLHVDARVPHVPELLSGVMRPVVRVHGYVVLGAQNDQIGVSVDVPRPDSSGDDVRGLVEPYGTIV